MISLADGPLLNIGPSAPPASSALAKADRESPRAACGQQDTAWAQSKKTWRSPLRPVADIDLAGFS
jgi:hypothetical protein